MGKLFVGPKTYFRILLANVIGFVGGLYFSTRHTMLTVEQQIVSDFPIESPVSAVSILQADDGNPNDWVVIIHTTSGQIWELIDKDGRPGDDTLFLPNNEDQPIDQKKVNQNAQKTCSI
jgi:hypothetical protein